MKLLINNNLCPLCKKYIYFRKNCFRRKPLFSNLVHLKYRTRIIFTVRQKMIIRFLNKKKAPSFSRYGNDL